MHSIRNLLEVDVEHSNCHCKNRYNLQYYYAVYLTVRKDNFAVKEIELYNSLISPGNHDLSLHLAA